VKRKDVCRPYIKNRIHFNTCYAKCWGESVMQLCVMRVGQIKHHFSSIQNLRAFLDHVSQPPHSLHFASSTHCLTVPST
jgi:hypothetical protein